jgi:hypothetical protein
MKKARIMLFSIVAIATMGGVLAFRAKKFAHKNVYCATIDEQSRIYCTITDYKLFGSTEATTSEPCKTWHDVVFGPSNALTTQHYTTTSIITPPNPRICGNPQFAIVFLTDTQ